MSAAPSSGCKPRDRAPISARQFGHGIVRRMDSVRLGSTFRAIRLELRLRQADVAARAGVSQQTVSSMERGLSRSIRLDHLEAVAEALQADIAVSVRWRGPKLARLLDRRHASLQNQVAGLLRGTDWEIVAEDTFNHFGDRGSVDILAWRAEPPALLIVEIKTEVVDLQDLLRALDVKVRLVPRLARERHGWKPTVVGVVLALRDSSTNRRAIATHSHLIDSSLPARTREVRDWIDRPARPLRGVIFLPSTPAASGIQQPEGTRRVKSPVRARSERPAAHIGPSGAPNRPKDRESPRAATATERRSPPAAR
jgi:transcriptional regulator with XRE-family HTH domain